MATGHPDPKDSPKPWRYLYHAIIFKGMIRHALRQTPNRKVHFLSGIKQDMKG